MRTPARFKIGFIHHAAGDTSMVLTDYQGDGKAIFLTRPFANPQEVLSEFAAIERALAAAKEEALALIGPDESGVSAAQRVFREVLTRVDPKPAPKPRQG